MSRSRGKVLALSTVGVGVVVMVAAGFAGKDWIREEWYLRRLEWGDMDDQIVAADKLSEMRSVRAIPILVAKLEAEALAKVHGFFYKGPPEQYLGRLGTRFKAALIKIGHPATLAALKARTHDDWRVSWIMDDSLPQIRPCPGPHDSFAHSTSCDVQILMQLRDDPAETPDVRMTAKNILDRGPFESR